MAFYLAILVLILQLVQGGQGKGKAAKIQATKVIDQITETVEPPPPTFAPRPKLTGTASTQKPTIKSQKVGRNDPCPCGSGKKYKKCHLGKPGGSKGK